MYAFGISRLTATTVMNDRSTEILIVLFEAAFVTSTGLFRTNLVTRKPAIAKKWPRHEGSKYPRNVELVFNATGRVIKYMKRSDSPDILRIVLCRRPVCKINIISGTSLIFIVGKEDLQKLSL